MIAAIAALFLPWHASADSSVLEYDSSGRLGHLRDVTPQSDDKTAPQAPDAAQKAGTSPGSSPGASPESTQPKSGQSGITPQKAGNAQSNGASQKPGVLPASPQDVGTPQKTGNSQINGTSQKNESSPRQGPQNGQPNPGAATINPDEWFEPGEVLAANPPPNFETAVVDEGFRVVEKIRFAALSFEVWRLRVPPGMEVAKAVAELRGLFPGLLVDANHDFHPSEGPSPSQSSARAAIGWSGLDPVCGEGIRIGMVDTPVDVTHPALAGQKITFRSFIRPERTPAPADHGTAIAAMLVGKPDPQGWGGLLPGAELLAGNIFTFNDAGEEVADTIAMLKALDWLASEQVHAVNLSMAGTDNRIMRFAIEQSSRRGMVLVAAVGNWGTSDRPAYPAAYSQVIGVTAIDSADTIYEYANRGPYVAFAAPGVQMWTAVPGGGKFQSGTSFAVPYLTSKIAAEIASGGEITADRFRQLLKAQATDLGPPGWDETFGWGVVKTPPRCARNAAAVPK